MDHDHTIIGWRAWYTGGRVFSSAEYLWEDLPANGILAIMAYEATRPYRVLCQCGSLYWRNADGSFGQWGFGTGRTPSEHPPFDGVNVKGGDWATQSEYDAVIEAALREEEPPA